MTNKPSNVIPLFPPRPLPMMPYDFAADERLWPALLDILRSGVVSDAYIYDLCQRFPAFGVWLVREMTPSIGDRP